MPVIVNEIIVSAQVDNSNSNTRGSGTSGSSSSAANGDAKLPLALEELKRILKEKNER